ncbi:AAA family ATPase [Thioclava kandeliae]|uniref:Chromosome segregation protein SMC n=1 Tax=Thioclava kandeliae TaxID=3070818 RepID=A0ABV1SJL7_9RHOB
MKLRAIRLKDVRRFTAQVEITGIGDGLNVLSEPNEYGKSTLFDALKALFFERHSSKKKEVGALRPHAGGAPEIEVEIETAQGRFTLAKRWFSKPMAEVRQNGRVIAQSDAAEDWIARLLGAGDGGPAGLIWVRQGMTELEGPVKAENEAALASRRDLMSSVTEEVEAMTGGRRMDMALRRVDGELARYVTASGKPRKNGPLGDVLDEIQRLETAQAEQQTRVEALHRDLETRKRHRKTLTDLEDPEERGARETRLAQAETAHSEALRHAEQVAAAARQLQSDGLAVTRAEERLGQMRSLRKEATEAKAGLEAAMPLAEAAAETEARTRAQAKELAAALEAAREAERQQAGRHARASLAEAARQGAARKAEIATRIEQAEAARTRHEEAQAEAGLLLASKDLETLQSLEQAWITEARLAAAGAVQLSFVPSGAQEIRLDGTPLTDTATPLYARADLDLPGLGQLTIDPGERAKAGAAQAAHTRLIQALERHGLPDMAAARRSAHRRAEREAAARDAQAELKINAPQGIEALRRDHAAIPAPIEDPELPPLAEVKSLLEAAQAKAAELAPQARLAEEKATEARLETGRLRGLSDAARERLQRAEDRLAESARMGDEDSLQAELTHAAQALSASRALHDDLRRKAPDLAGAEAAFKRARAVIETAQREATELSTELARLDERIMAANGQAIEEKLAETRDALEAARATEARLTHEVAVLHRLQAALEAARSAAREQYFAPVAKALRPLLGLLWPEAQLEWAQDKLLPEALVRAGQSEPIDILSGGTQEQIALMVRLAFARLLQEAGRGAPVILDDALVYTDDERIEKMFDALNRQAGDLQIIVLTCRQRAFRDLGGQRLHLTPAP